MCHDHDHDPTPTRGSPSSEPATRTLSRRGVLGGAAVAGAAAWAGSTARASGATRAAGRASSPTTMALHVHASYSEGAASMASQLECARESGVDVVWFTEHDWRMSRTDYRTQVSFDGLKGEIQYGRPWAWRPTTDGHPASSSGRLVTSPTSPRDPSSRAGALRASVTASKTSNGDSFLWYADATKSRQNYNSNVTGLSISIDVMPLSVDPLGFGELRILLSNKPASNDLDAGGYVLSYRFGAPSGRTAQGFLGAVGVPAPTGEWTTATLRPLDDVRELWPHLVAEDNAVRKLWLGATASSAQGADVVFDDLRLQYAAPAQLSPFDVQRGILADYAELYADITAHCGQEISFLPEHMNWFGGDDYLLPYTSRKIVSKLDPAETDRRARTLAARGGSLSINHPFGAGEDATYNTPTPAEVAARYLKYGAYAATMLEVGYAQRGGASLADHLGLWDVMSRNGVYLTGTGVNDNHDGLGRIGSGWDNDVNRFATSVWSPTTDQRALIAELDSGRAFCSEVTQRGLALDLSADGVAMGQVSVRPDLGSREVTLDVRGLPAGAKVSLLQGPVDYAGVGQGTSGAHVVATLDGARLANGPVHATVGTTASSFVRATVQDGDGRTVAFSNPLWLLRERSATAVPRPRVAADSA